MSAGKGRDRRGFLRVEVLSLQSPNAAQRIAQAFAMIIDAAHRKEGETEAPTGGKDDAHS